MKSRHELRESVFKILFQVENTDLDYRELLEFEVDDVSGSEYVTRTLDEILFTDIPYKVSINEAVELSKKYSEKDDSYKFINGVLKGIVETSTK